MQTELKYQVLHHLKHGKENALPGRILASSLGFRGTRQVRLAMVDLIVDGVPIVFSDRGYYIAENLQECQESLNKLRKYGMMLFRHYKHLKIASRKFTGQLKLNIGV